MAEVLIGLEAAETVVEGAAVGALAIRKPTVPLHVRFHQLQTSQSHIEALTRHSHTLSILDNVGACACIIGGEHERGGNDDLVYQFTLPASISQEVDIQSMMPKEDVTRPLASKTLKSKVTGLSLNLTRHGSTSIGSKIYLLGGRTANRPASEVSSSSGKLVVISFSTKTNEVSIVHPDPSSEVPCARIYPSCASSIHPTADQAINVTQDAYGTLFLHGGYSLSDSTAFRDTWSFDVSTRTWTRWPDIPDPGPNEVAGEGLICFAKDALWRVGDGFGKVSYLEFDKGGTTSALVNDSKGSAKIMPKTGEWTSITDTSYSAKSSSNNENQFEQPASIDALNHLPTPRTGASLLPFSTGKGREYLLYILGSDGAGSTTNDIWSFQLPSAPTTGAGLKDRARHVLGMESGEGKWARCEIVQSTKDEGPLELPGGLWRFGSDVWEREGKVVLWGGMNAQGVGKREGWILDVT